MINCLEYRNELASKFNTRKSQRLEWYYTNRILQMTYEINREAITINDLKEVQRYITTIP